jgi:hypothetical protein
MTRLVGSEMCIRDRTQTVMHELVHLIEITLNQCLTEQQVDTMALGLIHLFRANPGLLTLLERQE